MMDKVFAGAGNSGSAEDAMWWCKADEAAAEHLFCSAE